MYVVLSWREREEGSLSVGIAENHRNGCPGERVSVSWPGLEMATFDAPPKFASASQLAIHYGMAIPTNILLILPICTCSQTSPNYSSSPAYIHGLTIVGVINGDHQRLCDADVTDTVGAVHNVQEELFRTFKLLVLC